MRRFLYAVVLMILIASCKKDRVANLPPVQPSMNYIDLHDTVVVFHRGAGFDLDGNQTKDVYFGTLLVGDPLMQQDKWQWLVSSSFYANLPVNHLEQIPRMNKDDLIPVENFGNYNWYNASTILLAQKVIGMTSTFWEGEWKNASHHFVPIQILKNNGRYNGWVEISFNMNEEKLVLHKAAVSIEADKIVKAGR